LLKKTFSCYKIKENFYNVNCYYKKQYKHDTFIDNHDIDRPTALNAALIYIEYNKDISKSNKYIFTLNKAKSLYIRLNIILNIKQNNNNCDNAILLAKLKLFANILMIRKHRMTTFGFKFNKNKYLFTNRLRRYRYRKKYEFTSKRFEKIIRLKPLHFYIPQHLQRDFRTLRVIKINAPNLNSIFYAFRGSLVVFNSFFGSRGY
jgi:hypothetical protein